MQGVLLKVTGSCQRVFHEAGIVKGTDRCVMCHSGSYHFPSAGISRHEMRFDESGGDFQISFNKTTVQQYRGASFHGSSQIQMLFIVSGVMILHFELFHDPGISDHFPEFISEVGPMKPCCHQHGDVFQCDSSFNQFFHQRSEEKSVGNRSSDITYQDTGT